MTRIVRLTESDLTRIVKKAIKESLLLEANRKGLSKEKLESTYSEYNDKGSDGTFDEIFKDEREKGLIPFIYMDNGCATKVSLALIDAGQEVSRAFNVTNGRFKGKGIQTSAKGLKDDLIRRWGQPDVKIQNVNSLEQVQQKIGPGVSGVYICTPCFSDPKITGHATVWSWWKNDNKGGPLDDTAYPENNGGTVYFWRVGEKNLNLAKE